MNGSTMMRAASYLGPGDIRVIGAPVPVPAPDQILLKVTAASICGTDAHEFASGPHLYPRGGGFVPGHEFSGVVVEAGDDVEGFSPGDLVACGAGVSCGTCHWCRSDRTNHCEAYRTYGLQLQGALAQYVVVPARICIEVGSLGLSPDFAALAQPMAIAVHAARRGRVDPGESSVVVGAGGIGSFLTHVLTETGSPPAVIDLDPERLRIAGQLGALATAHPEVDVEADGFQDPSVVFEVTGTDAGFEQAMSLAGPTTRLVLVGLQSRPLPVDLRQVSLGEKELIGTNAHVFGSDFPQAVRLLAGREQGWSDVAPIAIPLESLVAEGIMPMVEDRPRPVKTVIDPWGSHRRPTV